MPDGEDTPAELIRRGWVQGSLIRVGPGQSLTVQRTVLLSGGPELSNEPREIDVSEEQLFVVATQTCDIAKSVDNEPWIEVMPVAWSAHSGTIRNARRNSTRLFLLRSERDEHEQHRGLIADASQRAFVAKKDLLTCTPESALAPGDSHTEGLFRRWLAQRYSRPAIPDEYVRALQKPLVEAIGRLDSTHRLHERLDGVDRVLFVVQPDTEGAVKVELIFLRNERLDEVAIDEEGVAELVGWMENVLRQRGGATIVHWDLYDSRTISLHDYVSAYPLALDQYTLLDDPDAHGRDTFTPYIG